MPNRGKVEAEAQLQWHIDGLSGSVVEGWLWCPQKPNQRYEVLAFCEGMLVGHSVANIFRPDLKQAKKSDGCIKFEVKLASFLHDGSEHEIQLFVRDSAGQNVLYQELGSPLVARLIHVKWGGRLTV